MAFAKYFHRDFVALNKLLNQDTGQAYKSAIESHLVCLHFDEQAEFSLEAQTCLELLLRITSRFYPKLKISANYEKAMERIRMLKNLATSINSNIEFATAEAKATIVLSLSKFKFDDNSLPIIYVGSDGWIAKISTEKPQTFSSSPNPFGASIAACIACSNVFRFVFARQLQLPLDENINFSVFDFARSVVTKNSPLPDVVLHDVNLVGVGAIGSACVWTLAKAKTISGEITLIDHDRIEESNLQRYILFEEKHETYFKVDIAAQFLETEALKVKAVNKKWSEFVDAHHNGNCKSRLVAVSIDNKEGRIHLQSSLPKKIINAYTDESRFGISRHNDFTLNTCLSCLYVPTQATKGRLEIMVEELNMKGFESLVYQYTKPQKLLDENFLKVFSERNQLNIADLEGYKQKSLGDFYIEMVCGYQMINMGSHDAGRGKEIEAPLSFQSAMAGIMLAAEIVLESLHATRSREVSEWQVLENVNGDNPSHYNYIKNMSKICLCGDDDYKHAYRRKWN